jgi:hypothetical protein
MADLFDNKILCKDCNVQMQKIFLIKEGFRLRALQCPKCKQKTVHPQDIEEFKKFQEIKHKNFQVKLRLVGNSYAVSIPKEIITFMSEQEKVMNEMVRLCFEESGKLSLMFGDFQDNKQKELKRAQVKL